MKQTNQDEFQLNSFTGLQMIVTCMLAFVVSHM